MKINYGSAHVENKLICNAVRLRKNHQAELTSAFEYPILFITLPSGTDKD
jgi:hypothetical protein